MSKELLKIIMMVLLILLPCTIGMAAGQEPLIRVGVLNNQISVLVSSDAPFELIGENGKSLGHFKAQERVTVSARVSGIAVNGIVANTSVIRVRQERDSSDTSIEVNKRHYRRIIDIRRSIGKTGLTVINTLPIEEYLYGIITKEISPDWSLEAIKAQAVAARTYALYNMDKHQAEGFDVCATTDCQVYGGRDSEAARATKAVNDTRGLVALYRGKLIPTYFHSSAGGYTESSENVWGAYQPYLRAVPDFDQKSPHYKWERRLSPDEVERLIVNAGYYIGKLQLFELSSLASVPIQTHDRGTSGRVKQLRVSGTEGTVTVTGARFRTILGLPSTLFDIQVIVPIKNNIEFEITDSYGDRETKKVEVNLSPVPEKGLITDKKDIRRIAHRPDEVILITGYGWGHGVGLSQWGAKAMAEKAPAADTEYFKSILKHYYQGIDIQKSY